MSMKSNFAKILDPQGWNAYAAAQCSDKKPMPSTIYNFLQEFIENKRNLDGTTFRYIAEYLETGDNIQPYRLEVACSDFGYTLCEIDSLRMNGKTTRDIAAEIVSRGVRST